MRRSSNLQRLLLMLVLAGCNLAVASPITYQGQLRDGGQPAEGSYDLQFCLFDADEEPVPLACTGQFNNVQVSAGLFTLELDFGPDRFLSEPRLIEIRVRRAGAGGFSILAPRQRLRPTPRAQHAGAADQVDWSGLSGVPELGTVTSVGAGAGLTGGPITTSGSLAIAPSGITGAMIAPGAVGATQIADGAIGAAQIDPAEVQQRISGSCAAGTYLRAINVDGTLDCDLLPVRLDRLIAGPDPAGEWISVAMRADGRPVMSYLRAFPVSLMLYDCADPACLSGTERVLEATGNQGVFSSIAVRPDGRPIIAHYDEANTALKVYDCANPACSSGTGRILDNTGSVGAFTSLALRSDGTAVISYRDQTNTALKLYVCANVNCSAGTARTLDPGGQVGSGTAIAVRSDDRPIVAFRDQGNVNLKLYDCFEPACTSGIIRTIDNTVGSGFDPAIAIRPNGLPVVAHIVLPNQLLKVVRCNDVGCASRTSLTLPGAGELSSPSLAIRADGRPLISVVDIAAQRLLLRDCNDADCNGGFYEVVDDRTEVADRSAIAMTAGDRPVLVYQDLFRSRPRLVICTTEC